MPDDLFISPEDVPILSLEDSLEELVPLTPESKARSIKEQRESLEITYSLERTYVVLIAIHRDSSRNNIHKIPCKKCLPIGGYVYDATTDSYTISCADYMVLGYIPLSMVVRVQGMGNFVCRMPMCESVVRRFLVEAQKKDVKSFRSVYRSEDHHHQFIQMIDCNG